MKFMYITNSPEIARIAESASVDRIFVDMEYIGKDCRQDGLNTVKNHHTIDDVKNIRKVISSAKLLVRCNPIHEAGKNYSASMDEIDSIIDAGADIIMLPFFKTVSEVKTFLDLVGGRIKTLLLLETPEAVECVDEILQLDGIDEILIGLNDLSLGYGKKFMFEPLADGTVEMLCNKFKAKGITYGFGGVASLGHGMLKAENVIAEHYRLGSTLAILSRSFCNTNQITDIDKINAYFNKGVKEIREYENKCKNGEIDFERNRREVIEKVNSIVVGLENN